MTSLGNNEILILGGDGDQGLLSDAYILDTKQMNTTQIFQGGIKLSTWSNQIQRTGTDELTALVQDEDWQPFLINYSISE